MYATLIWVKQGVLYDYPIIRKEILREKFFFFTFHKVVRKEIYILQL